MFLRTVGIVLVASIGVGAHGSEDGVAETQPQAGYLRLELEHQRQALRMCVPTSASMVLRHYGEERTPRELKRLATPPDSDFEGTYFRDMVRGVRALGYEWAESCYPTDHEGFERGFRDLRRSLDLGRPVLVGLFDPPVGHTVVFVGYDNHESEVFLVDPNLRAPGRRSMSYGEFEREWRENIVDYRCGIFTAPK